VGVFAVREARSVVFLGLLAGLGGFTWLLRALVLVVLVVAPPVRLMAKIGVGVGVVVAVVAVDPGGSGSVLYAVGGVGVGVVVAVRSVAVVAAVGPIMVAGVSLGGGGLPGRRGSPGGARPGRGPRRRACRW
jgi:hypothetical protein